MKGTSIAGRKRSDGIDYYQTPSWAVEKLLEHESFEGVILEPCCGAGAITKVLEDAGYEVISSDIRTDDDVYGAAGQDILKTNLRDVNYKFDNIITNPPYFCAKEVIEKSLELTSKKVAMILKLTFLESSKRYEFFKNTPLKTVYVFCKRVTMKPEGIEKPRNSGTITYAWYVWEHGYIGNPQIQWII